MVKLKTEQKEYILLGMFIGVLVAIRIGTTWGLWQAIAAGIACALIIGLLFGNWLSDKSEHMKLVVKYGIEGIMVGLIIAAGVLKMQPVAIIAGILIGLGVYGFAIGTFVWKQKQKDHYISFRGEAFLVSFLGLCGALAGYGLAKAIAVSRFKSLIPGLLAHQTGLSIALIIVCSLLLSVPWGFLVAINRRRPILGAVFAMIAGALVLWVGISIAPMLFLPGSGLYWAGMVMGLMIIGCSLLAVAFPKSHIPMGIAIVAFSILSFIGAAGGLIVGGLIGLLAGSLIVSWIGPEEINAGLPVEMGLEAAAEDSEETQSYDYDTQQADSLADMG